MSFTYQKLLSPYQLNERVVLKNRLTFPNATQSQLQGPETWPAEPMLNEVAQICTSGASLMSFPHFGKLGGGSRPRGKNGGWDYTDHGVQKYLCQAAALAHMFGSKILVKLGAAWPDGTTYGGGDARSLFPLPEGTGITTPPIPEKPLTYDEMQNRICPKERIPQVIEELVDMAAQYKSWGFDGINFRVDRYIDASTNLRTDEYGGEIENRGRFCFEVFDAIKKRLGPDFLIEIAMPGKQDHGMDGEMPHGYTLEEAIRLAHILEPVVDIIQLRESGFQRYHPTGYNSTMHKHESLEFCKAFKDAGIQCTISANSGFVDPEDMAAALESGVCDLISAGRAFRAETEFTKKLYSYQTERPCPCIQCDICHGMGKPPYLSFCAVNPKIGMQHRLPGILNKPYRAKKVAVIGGGAIGMRAACFAAEAGHSVTLFEKSDYLGGKMKYADLYRFKWPIKRYRDWLKDELIRRKVDVHLNCELSADELSAKGFDAVIACTGSVAVKPNVPGADSDEVWTAEDVYMGRAVLGENVIVVGGASVAVETAMYLAEEGKNVTVITRKAKLAMDDEHPHDGLHVHSEKFIPELGYGGYVPAWRVYDNFNEIVDATAVEVTARSVTYEKDGSRNVASGDSVVVTGGYRGLLKEALAYAGCAPEFYMAGDVEDSCNNLQQGNVSAFGKCSLL